MAVALPLTTKITSVGRPVKARLLSMSFGGGYIQTAANGVNNLYDTYSIQWGNLSLADRDTVVAAIRSTLGVDYFTWTAPGESVSKKFIIPPESDASLYDEQIQGGGYYSISMQLRQIS